MVGRNGKASRLLPVAGIVMVLILLATGIFAFPFINRAFSGFDYPLQSSGDPLGIRVHYYDREGREFNPNSPPLQSVVGGQPDVFFVNFDVLGRNDGEVPLQEVRIGSASPVEFSAALASQVPLTNVAPSPALGVWWSSDLMETSQFESVPQPVVFSVGVDADFLTAEGVVQSISRSDSLSITIENQDVVRFRTNAPNSGDIGRYSPGTFISIQFSDEQGSMRSYGFFTTTTGSGCPSSNRLIYDVKTPLGFDVYEVNSFVPRTDIAICANNGIQYLYLDSSPDRCQLASCLSTAVQSPYSADCQEVYVDGSVASGCTSPPSLACSDGTEVGFCVVGDKPQFCAPGQVLVDDCVSCGCSDDIYGNPAEGCNPDGSCLYREYNASFEINVE